MQTIPLSKGTFATVDDWWYPILSKWKWYSSNGYACREVGGRINRERVFMHRYITMAPAGWEVDHRNRTTLDNREENLRVVVPAKNYLNRAKQSNNTTGYKGVCFDKARGKYLASISLNNHQTNLGRFATAIEAAQAYDTAAKDLHGEFACINGV